MINRDTKSPLNEINHKLFIGKFLKVVKETSFKKFP